MTNGGKYVLVLRLRATSPGRSCFFMVVYDCPFDVEDESVAEVGVGIAQGGEWRSRCDLPPT